MASKKRHGHIFGHITVRKLEVGEVKKASRNVYLLMAQAARIGPTVCGSAMALQLPESHKGWLWSEQDYKDKAVSMCI